VIATACTRKLPAPLSAAERAAITSHPMTRATSPACRDPANVDGLIFCFPMVVRLAGHLKGYVDRVGGPASPSRPTRPAAGSCPCSAMSAVRVVTSYGSPWWFAPPVAGDPGRKVMLRALRPLCARGAETFYLAHTTWTARRRNRGCVPGKGRGELRRSGTARPPSPGCAAAGPCPLQSRS